MSAFRPLGYRSLQGEALNAGDCELIATSMVNATENFAGNYAWFAQNMVSGYVYRTGPTGAYTDATDTGANILTALSGNAPNPTIVPGLGFIFRVFNTVAFAETTALGQGIVQGLGNLNIPASTWKDFLCTCVSTQPQVTIPANTTSGSPVLTFTLPAGQLSLPEGPAFNAVNIQPGCSVTGTGIPANTTVLGVTQGQGGVVGVTLSQNATAAGTNVNITFNATFRLDSLGGGTL